MGLPVIRTPQALEYPQQIVSFIARDNSEGAQSFGNELIDKALTLANMPEGGRAVPELNESDLREIIHSSYRIITSYSKERFMFFAFGTGRAENRLWKDRLKNLKKLFLRIEIRP